ncbi:hypothetical protein MBLNU230_g7550t1 [Neophaeotheca triangularis]
MAYNGQLRRQTAPVSDRRSNVLGGGVRQTHGFSSMTPQPFQSMPTPQFTSSVPEYYEESDKDPIRPVSRAPSTASDWSFQSQAPLSQPLPRLPVNHANSNSGHGDNHMFHDLVPAGGNSQQDQYSQQLQRSQQGEYLQQSHYAQQGHYAQQSHFLPQGQRQQQLQQPQQGHYVQHGHYAHQGQLQQQLQQPQQGHYVQHGHYAHQSQLQQQLQQPQQGRPAQQAPHFQQNANAPQAGGYLQQNPHFPQGTNLFPGGEHRQQGLNYAYNNYNGGLPMAIGSPQQQNIGVGGMGMGGMGMGGMGMGMGTGMAMNGAMDTGMRLGMHNCPPQQAPRPTHGTMQQGSPQFGGYGKSKAGIESSPPSVLTPMPSEASEQQNRARYLVDLIKRGGIIYDDDDDDNYGSRRGGRRRNTAQGRGGHSRYNSGSNDNGRGMGRHQSVSGYHARDSMPSIPENQVSHTRALSNTLVIAPNPTWLHAALAGHYKPTYQQLTETLPFVEPKAYIRPTKAQVIKIKNIPFTASRSEVLASLGSRARVVTMPRGSSYFAVHIIMERMSGKTMDAYVELEDQKEVERLMEQFETRFYSQRRPIKVGDRAIEIERSSQAELMKELFPRAKCVTWQGTKPIIGTTTEQFRPGVFASGFRGFLTSEENVMMTKHAEVPHRSVYAQRSRTRTYECLISTLHKYPWAHTEHIAIKDRDRLFITTRDLIHALVKCLHDGRNDNAESLTPQVLQELTMAALGCPGFNEVQKADLVYFLFWGGFGQFASATGHSVRFGGIHPYSAQWPFKVLALKPDSSAEVIEYYATLMREGRQDLSLANCAASRAFAEQNPHFANLPFGKVTIDYGEDPASLKMSEAAEKEWGFLEGLLRSLGREELVALQNAFSGFGI